MRWDNSHGQDHLKAYIRYQEDDNDDGEDDDNDLYIIGGCRYVTKHVILPAAYCDRNFNIKV